MPQEPKKKHSKSRKRIRRASISLGAASLVICPNCNSKNLSHMACRNCGFYAGKAPKNFKQKTVVTKA